MIKIKNKKNIFIVGIMSVLLLICSVFAFFSFNRNENVFADINTTNFIGSNIYFPTTPQYSGYDTSWSQYGVGSPLMLDGYYIWNCNGVQHYDYNDMHYYYDAENSRFLEYTWNITNLNAVNVWEYNGNYYYNDGSTTQYVLDISTMTWQTSNIWTLPTGMYGVGFFVAFGNVYYAYQNQTQYFYYNNSWQVIHFRYRPGGSSWSPIYFVGSQSVWSGGNNLYYISVNSSFNLIFDGATNFNLNMVSLGVTGFAGLDTWIYNNNVMLTFNSVTYRFNYQSRVFTTFNFTGSYIPVVGRSIWSVGNWYYYNNGSTRYSLYLYEDIRTSTLMFDSVYFSFFQNVDGSMTIKQYSMFITDFNNTTQFSVSDKFVLFSSGQTVGDYTDSDFVDSLTFDLSLSFTGYIPFEYNSTYYYSYISIYTSSLSNCLFEKVDFENEYNTYSHNYINKIIYTNTLGETITISFFCLNIPSATQVDYFGDIYPFSQLFDNIPSDLSNYNFLFKPRTYFLNPEVIQNYQYELGYKYGLANGEESGYEVGFSDGQQSGYSNGFRDGKNAGYNDGIADANDYSFIGLISAVIDVPIKAFSSLFNFDLLGVNMLAFVSALISLAVIITIIKKVI